MSLNNGFKDEDPVPLKMLITFLSGIYRDVTSWEKLLPPTFFFVVTCWERIFIQWRYRGRKKRPAGTEARSFHGGETPRADVRFGSTTMQADGLWP